MLDSVFNMFAERCRCQHPFGTFGHSARTPPSSHCPAPPAPHTQRRAATDRPPVSVDFPCWAFHTSEVTPRVSPGRPAAFVERDAPGARPRQHRTSFCSSPKGSSLRGQAAVFVHPSGGAVRVAPLCRRGERRRGHSDTSFRAGVCLCFSWLRPSGWACWVTR